MNSTTTSDLVFQINVLTLVLCALFVWLGRTDKASHRIAFGALTAFMLCRYVYWRFTQTLPSADEGFRSVWAYVFVTFEMIAVAYTLFSIVVMTRRRDGTPRADAGEARLRAAVKTGEPVPAVDVFICTYNEELTVLEKTIITARAIDYPHVNVWVLDDTRRDWLRDYCAEKGVYYARRPDNSHAKAGNLNNGLKQSAAVTNAPYILVLDADFAPQHNILYRVLGLFDEPKVALVQTPQFYYNPDPIQHNLQSTDSWVDEQRVFFDVFQPAKDAWDAAFCVGTSFVVDRSVITEAGGFPTGSVCEDIHTSYLLRQRGFLTRWLNERLSIGLSAEGLIEYINQRSRWCLGTMQVALLHDGPLRGKGFTLNDRAHYVHGMLHWLSKPFILLMLFAPILYWFCNVAAFYTTPEAFFLFGMPALLAFWSYNSWITDRRTLPVFTEVTQIVSSLTVTMTIASACIRPFGRPFKVTAKGLDRTHVVVHWKLASLFIALLIGLIVGAVDNVLLAPLSAGSMFNLMWTLLALVLDLAAIIACVDLPRYKSEERFPLREAARWTARGVTHDAQLVDISIKGAALQYRDDGGDDVSLPRAALPRAGERIVVDLEGVGNVSAIVARSDAGLLGVVFDIDTAMRERLIVKIFANAPSNVAVKAHPWRAMGRLFHLAGWRLPRRTTAQTARTPVAAPPVA